LGEPIRPTDFDARTLTIEALKGKDERMLSKLRLAMLNHGVDLKGYRGGIVSAVHTDTDIAYTLDAWHKSLRALKDEEKLPGIRASGGR
jgi:glutamate-1-semialdehyde 2,1-aminomutase